MTFLTARGWLAVTGAVSAGIAIIGFSELDTRSRTLVLNFFQEHLREPLFVGLLTVAAFLFSLQTFIVVTMKEHVYDTEAYADRVEQLKALNPKIKRYQPLDNFSYLLFLAILLCFLSAVLQFSIGLVDAPWAGFMSLFGAVWSIEMIFVSLFYLQRNLRSWFDILDKGQK
ncbi:MAG TPA: hypothetical protein VMS78_03345 [Rhizomicrobium sp.]|nr:hypothetical protein [Rhizomicrobium sp.]